MTSAPILTGWIVVLVLFGGFESATPGGSGSSPAQQPAGAPARTEAPPAMVCPVSKTIQDEPPEQPDITYGSAEWYVNADRTIWVAKNSWQAGSGGNKVIWIRPAGTTLVITGRRLDAQAPPPRASPDRGYPTGFTVTGLYFPASGCWEITAKAGSKELRFVTEVLPPAPAHRTRPANPS